MRPDTDVHNTEQQYASTDSFVDEHMKRLGFCRAESGQWVSMLDSGSTPATNLSGVLPTDWPGTQRVIRRKGRKRSDRYAAVEEGRPPLDEA